MPAEVPVVEEPVADRESPRITLLGPQRTPRVRQVVERLGLTGSRFATINAGWRDREGEDELLSGLLGGNVVNLRLWQRMQQVWDADPELAEGDRRRRQVLTEMQELYQIGIVQAVEALQRIRAHAPRTRQVKDIAQGDVEQIIRDMDVRHLERVTEVHQDFYARFEPQHRGSVLEARFQVGREIAGCDAVVIPGGHIGVLLGALHLFNLGPALADLQPGSDRSPVGPRPYRPILAWGAGAMALTQRPVLFYDHAAQGPDITEAFMDGLALTRDVVALPSAKDRLEMRDTVRMATLVRRFAPGVPLLLDTRAEVTLTAAGRVPDGARVLLPDGTPGEHVAPGPTAEQPPQPRPDPATALGEEPA